MKFPKEINCYCPFCKSHQVHKVKLASKGSSRSLARGNRAFNRKLTGHGGKRAGKKTVKKQGKRQKIILTCPTCKKKHQRVVTTRTTKKLEFKA
jgi:large subunit ribosomal protein L44e